MIEIYSWNDHKIAERVVNIYDHDNHTDGVQVSESHFDRSFLAPSRTPYEACKSSLIEVPESDLQLLFDYLRQPGKVVQISGKVATQTIQYLKETH